MGNARFLSANLIWADSMLSADSERPGQIGLAPKFGYGGKATLEAGGSYTGPAPEQYGIQIDSISGGQSIGQATFMWWRATEGPGSPRGTLVPTSASPITLEYGVTVKWVTGGSPDFTSYDYWILSVAKQFGARQMLDRDRDTEWRSASGLNNAVRFTIDLLSAQQVAAVAMIDTNFRESATVNIFCAAALGDLWSGLVGSTPSGYGLDPYGTEPYGGTRGSGVFSFGLTNGVHYLTAPQTFRYWGIEIDDLGNPDGYLRVGELFLGSYVEFSANFGRGWTRTQHAATFGPAGALRTPRGIWGAADAIDFPYQLMTPADRAKAVALFDDLYDPFVGIVRPAFVNPDSANGSDVSLYELDPPSLPIVSPYLNLFEWSLRLRQRPRIARSGI